MMSLLQLLGLSLISKAVSYFHCYFEVRKTLDMVKYIYIASLFLRLLIHELFCALIAMVLPETAARKVEVIRCSLS